jgi:hypothetical protein
LKRWKQVFLRFNRVDDVWCDHWVGKTREGFFSPCRILEKRVSVEVVAAQRDEPLPWEDGTTVRRRRGNESGRFWSQLVLKMERKQKLANLQSLAHLSVHTLPRGPSRTSEPPEAAAISSALKTTPPPSTSHAADEEEEGSDDDDDGDAPRHLTARLFLRSTFVVFAPPPPPRADARAGAAASDASCIAACWWGCCVLVLVLVLCLFVYLSTFSTLAHVVFGKVPCACADLFDVFNSPF